MSASTTIGYRRPAMRAAYIAGRAALAERVDTNPFIQERDPELYAEWDEGYADELAMQADNLFASLDVSMCGRDL